MKKNILSLVLLALLATASHASGRPLVNSHLRIWNSAIVETHLKLGADIVELDIFKLSEPELQRSLDVLVNYPGKFVALHLKGIGEVGLPELESLIGKNEKIWSQLWFFSGDAAVDARIRLKFPLAYVSRSTKQNVIACLSYGLNDEQVFLVNCVEKDLWLRPAMMQNKSDRARMKQLVEKIRTYEKVHPVTPSLVALDQIDSMATYCDFVPEFSMLVDGIVSEDFASVAAITNGQEKCP